MVSVDFTEKVSRHLLSHISVLFKKKIGYLRHLKRTKDENFAIKKNLFYCLYDI